MRYTKFSDPVGQRVESYLLLFVATLVRLPSGLSSSLSWTLGYQKLHVRPYIVRSLTTGAQNQLFQNRTRAYAMITSQHSN